MKSQTHIIFCIFICLLLFKIVPISGKILFILISIIFTLLPDIDESRSKIGRRVKPFSYLLKHRGFFHSIWIPLIFVLLLYKISFELSFAIFTGYLAHLILDSITYQGIMFLYPLKFRIKGFVKTGGWFEWFLSVILVLSVIWMIL